MLNGMTSLFAGQLPQLIAFDLDGTLVDSVPDLAVTTDRMLVGFGHRPAGEVKVRCWVGNGAAKLVSRALADAHGIDETELEDTLSASGLQAFRKIYSEENGKLSRLYPGVVDVLDALKGLNIPLVVITNKPKVFAEPLLEQLGILAYFNAVIGGDCLAERKPHPMPLLQCCQSYDVKPENCLMVGDSCNDILAAKSAGFRSAALTYGYNHGKPISESNPDWLMDEFRELLL